MTSQVHSLVAASVLATLIPAAALAAGGGPSTGEPDGDRAPIDRIVQGEVTDDFPATAALMGDGMAFCTGTLVGARLVVTAAHCLEDGAPESIYFGSEPGGAGTVVGVQSVVAHPQYEESGGWVGDIGVVLLSESPAGIAPVPLSPRNADDLTGAVVTYVGYGDTQGTGGEGYKKKANGHITELIDDYIEVQPEDGSACYGDSGGGVYHEDGGVLTVLGVVSFGYTDDCMDPGGNTRTDIYAEWIAEQGGGDLPDPGDGNASDDDDNTDNDDDDADGDRVAARDDDTNHDPRRDGAGCSIGDSSPADGALSLALLLVLGATTPRRRSPSLVPGATAGLTNNAER